MSMNGMFSKKYWNHSNRRLQLAGKVEADNKSSIQLSCWGEVRLGGSPVFGKFLLRQVSSDVGRMVIRAPGFLHPFLEESYGRLHMKARADRVRKTLFGGTQHPFVKISLRCFITCKKWMWTCVDRYRVMIYVVFASVQSCTIHASLSRSESGLSAERSSNNCKVPEFMWLSGRWGLKAKKTTLSYRKVLWTQIGTLWKIFEGQMLNCLRQSSFNRWHIECSSGYGVLSHC